MMGGVVAALNEHPQHPHPAAKVFGVGLLVALAVGATIFGVRSALSGVVVDADRVTIRNIFHSTVLDWDDIERFSAEPRGWWTIGYVHLRNATAIQIWGIQSPNRFLFPNSGWAIGPIEQLNALLRGHR